MHGPCFVVDNGDRIVDRVIAGLVQVLSRCQRIDRQVTLDMDDLLSRPPGLSAIGAPPQQDVNGTPVSPITFASLTIGQNRSLCGDDDARNAIKSVPVLACLKQIDLFDSGCRGTAHTDQEQRFQECFHY